MCVSAHAGNACPPGCCSGEGYSLCSAYDGDRDESLGGPGPDYDGAGWYAFSQSCMAARTGLCVSSLNATEMDAGARSVVENAVAQFYGVFGVIILLTVLVRIPVHDSVLYHALYPAENTAPLLPRTCMFCKIFSDDQEMATNQKIGLCDYLRTERMYISID